MLCTLLSPGGSLSFQTLSVKIDIAVGEGRQGRVLSAVRLCMHRVSNTVHHIPKQSCCYSTFIVTTNRQAFTQLASLSARRPSLDASQHHVYVRGVAASFDHDIRTTTHAVGELLLRHHPRWKRGSNGVGVGVGA